MGTDENWRRRCVRLATLAAMTTVTLAALTVAEFTGGRDEDDRQGIAGNHLGLPFEESPSAEVVLIERDPRGCPR